MGAVYRRKRRSCKLCKPHKMGLAPADTAKQRQEARLAMKELADLVTPNPWVKNGLSKDVFQVALGRYPKPEWFVYYKAAHSRNFGTNRWGYNLRLLNRPAFNVLYARFVATGKIDLSDPGV